MEVCQFLEGDTANADAFSPAEGSLIQKFVQSLAREVYTCYSYSRATVMYIYTVSR